MSSIFLELQKKVSENTIKIENRNEEEWIKDVKDELRSQSKKGKDKKSGRRDSSDDDDKDPRRPVIKSQSAKDERDILEILRDDKEFIIVDHFKRIDDIDWGKLICMLWTFIKDCVCYGSMNNEAAEQYVRNFKACQNVFTCTKKIKNNPKANDLRLSDKSLESVL
jgi:hypothetical protein